jgi:hypothetical protein
MPQCLDNMDASGFMGDDVRSFQTPDTLVDICPGDFLKANTVNSCRQAALISTVAWNASLLQTQKDAKVAFEGVSLQELDVDTCVDAPDCIPYDNYVRARPSKFRRSYEIVHTDGVATPTTWVRGQGFTFGKNASSNALVNNKIQKTSDADAIVFRAVEDSCGETLGRAMVEYAD